MLIRNYIDVPLHKQSSQTLVFRFQSMRPLVHEAIQKSCCIHCVETVCGLEQKGSYCYWFYEANQSACDILLIDSPVAQ